MSLVLFVRVMYLLYLGALINRSTKTVAVSFILSDTTTPSRTRFFTNCLCFCHIRSLFILYFLAESMIDMICAISFRIVRPSFTFFVFDLVLPSLKL